MTDEGSIVLVYVDCVNLCMLTGHAYVFRIGVVWEVLTAWNSQRAQGHTGESHQKRITSLGIPSEHTGLMYDAIQILVCNPIPLLHPTH